MWDRIVHMTESMYGVGLERKLLPNYGEESKLHIYLISKIMKNLDSIFSLAAKRTEFKDPIH